MRAARGLAGLALVAAACHTNPHFQGLEISEVRYVRGEDTADQACGAFVELHGPAGMSIGGLKLQIFSGSTLVRSYDLPPTTTIPDDGYLLISNAPAVKASDRATSVTVDYQVPGYPGWDWLPHANDSGVSIVLDDPAVPGTMLEVVDSLRYNPSGSATASWWEVASPAAAGVGEELPAPGLPRFSTADPAWGLSRIAGEDLDASNADFLVASVTPGTANEQLWYDQTTELPPVFRPVIEEVMPNTNGFNDENSFVEIWAVAGQRWDAGPGTYELIAFNGNSPPGGQRNWLALSGVVPGGGYFVVADSPHLPAQYGGAAPTQEVHCTDLHLPSSACTGAAASEWDWLGNNLDAGVRLEYWVTATRRVIVSSLRWSPANPAETVNLFRQGEGLAPIEPSSPATSFSRFGSTSVNRKDFLHADPTPGGPNAAPTVAGQLVSRYGASFPHLDEAPAAPNGKLVLFDQTKRQKAGPTGHWIITENGDYTDWAWQLWNLGYRVKAKGTGNPGAAETIGASDLAGVQVLVIAEPQTAYTPAERAAIVSFLQAGGSLFFIANHKGSDRDSDGWDAWRVWMESLDFDALTGVALADADTRSENLVARPTAAAAGHPVLTDVAAPACASGPSCSLVTSVLFRPPGVGLFAASFIQVAATLPAGITQVTPLLEGERPFIARDPHRLDRYGGAAPTERWAAAVQTSWGGGAHARILLLGDSAVLNDGGSSDYATYAASLAYDAYGTSNRNSLFGVNAVNWLAGLGPTAGAALPPSLQLAP